MKEIWPLGWESLSLGNRLYMWFNNSDIDITELDESGWQRGEKCKSEQTAVL